MGKRKSAAKRKSIYTFIGEDNFDNLPVVWQNDLDGETPDEAETSNESQEPNTSDGLILTNPQEEAGPTDGPAAEEVVARKAWDQIRSYKANPDEIIGLWNYNLLGN